MRAAGSSGGGGGGREIRVIETITHGSLWIASVGGLAVASPSGNEITTEGTAEASEAIVQAAAGGEREQPEDESEFGPGDTRG